MFSGHELIQDDVLACLDNRPSILEARNIGNRVLSKMREYVEMFVYGIMA